MPPSNPAGFTAASVAGVDDLIEFILLRRCGVAVSRKWPETVRLRWV
jgi:hypothetical protein